MSTLRRGKQPLLITNPDLAKEWDYEKNAPLTPNDVTAGSGKKVWWVCSLGHSWPAAVSKRSSGQNCPVCSNKKVLSGFNDLATKNPELALEWDYTNNKGLTSPSGADISVPSKVVEGSHYLVYWKCKQGHSFKARIDQHQAGSCPICSNHTLLVGYNDLGTVHPELCNEWDYTKNAPLTPQDVMNNSGLNVWWKCLYGHSWRARISHRTVSKSNCPVCAKDLKTSFPEQALFYYIKQAYPDAVNSEKTTIGLELDIYVPSLRFAFEYDGYAWHKSEQVKKLDIQKKQLCMLHNITLFRIRELGLDCFDNCCCVVRADNTSDSSLSQAIKEILLHINAKYIDVDVTRDKNDIYAEYLQHKKENSFVSEYPELVKEWNNVKNGVLTPDMFSAGSDKKVWWLCSICNYEWSASIYVRTSGHGCPQCNQRKALLNRSSNLILKKGSLSDKYPEIAKEWNINKNNGVFPNAVTAGSTLKVWWVCSRGHEWEATICNRTKGRGCPVCARLHQAERQSKPVLCVESGEIYKSVTIASEVISISRSAIIQCCTGKTKTAGGYHWKYIDQH